MTWYLWIFVTFLLLTAFGLGCIVTRTAMISRGEGKMFSNRKANAVLSVFFTLIAIVIAIDTVHLHVQFNRYMKNQLACNTETLRVNAKIAESRAKVDHAAAMWDIAMHQHIDAEAQGKDLANDPSFVTLQSALESLTNARLDMLRVYANNPMPKC